MSRRLELILKLTERCNIACTYCYYFENEQKSALTRPPYLTDEVARQFVHRVHETIREGHHQNVRIIMHGGEPMMYGNKRRRISLRKGNTINLMGNATTRNRRE